MCDPQHSPPSSPNAADGESPLHNLAVFLFLKSNLFKDRHFHMQLNLADMNFLFFEM